jgi:hypothetical protein
VLWPVLLAKYSTGDQIKNNEMGGARNRYGKGIGLCRIQMAKPEGKILL